MSYNPRQPRNSQGEWTSGGGGGIFPRGTAPSGSAALLKTLVGGPSKSKSTENELAEVTAAIRKAQKKLGSSVKSERAQAVKELTALAGRKEKLENRGF